MKRIGTASVDELLEQVNASTFRHVTGEGYDFWALRPSQIGPYFGRVVRLFPGGRLHIHTDDGDTRLVIVLETNPQAVTTVDGIEYVLEAGGVYETDPRLPHGAVNHGQTNRTHLIVDHHHPDDPPHGDDVHAAAPVQGLAADEESEAM